ncbi:GNAT family N-acetyltransferase [Mycetocola tolaasinivorans]|uniref:GNAT family N-acetyltransferase n=1 Tax=Mycetocola tolaasinivorans TaxID=76635 RepID=A0A3L7A414_9MICO|nr:GNAT family N-acetyltransferase [Mycetocola tolaasinivorans]RLP75076.1 GNAT family N-acetyltransferase [Mycetocola tolaasinivorans]
MTNVAAYLRAYDDQLRTDAEVRAADSVETHGPLRLATFAGGHGFVTYRDLGEEAATAESVAELVRFAHDYFASRDDVVDVEWKTRAHDSAPGLHDALVNSGFVPDDSESVMIGALEALTENDPAAELAEAGIIIRRITTEAEVRAMSAMAAIAFEEDEDTDRLDEMIEELSGDSGVEFWVAEADGVIVSAGRLEPVADTDVVGIWGGATLHEYRGRGIYRALTAARARAALAAGKRFVHSDSTEFSRPILERSGLVKVTETTPYIWER